MTDAEAVWEQINVMRDRQSAAEARMAANDATVAALIEKVDLSRQERTEQYLALSAKMDSLGKTVQIELAEYRGALRFGKWLAGILIALGVPAGLLALWGGHR